MSRPIRRARSIDCTISCCQAVKKFAIRIAHPNIDRAVAEAERFRLAPGLLHAPFRQALWLEPNGLHPKGLKSGDRPAVCKAGLARAGAECWVRLYESGTYVRLTAIDARSGVHGRAAVEKISVDR